MGKKKARPQSKATQSGESKSSSARVNHASIETAASPSPIALSRQNKSALAAQSGDSFAHDVSETTWRAACLSILAGAALLRLYDLSLVPLHHDEGVNGFFLTTLARSGVYHYDPANYHGPTLYYFALLAQFVLGLNTFALRFVPALFGLASIGLILCLRKHLGAVGALTASAFLAVSPGAVYMSRYFIHESLFVFFTLGIVVAALYYYETARPVYLLLAAASAALLFATKETAMISASVLLIALVITRGCARFFADSFDEHAMLGKKGNAATRHAANVDTPSREPLSRFGGAGRVALLAFAALALFVFLNILFYSSFFTYAKGVSDSIATFKLWTRTGTKDHLHDWYTYFDWLRQEELLLLVVGAAGVFTTITRALQRRARASNFALFAALWSIGIIAAYSLVPYKTPWLALNFIVPLAIIGGYCVGELYRFYRSADARHAVLAFAGICVAVALYQSLVLNFRHYDNDAYPYVYAHTRRETLQLVDEIQTLARRAGTNENTTIAFASPDYWPLPWYLRDYKRVGYNVAMPHPVAQGSGESIVIGNETQEAQMRASLGDAYTRVGAYALRPGVNLVLYARRDLIK